LSDPSVPRAWSRSKRNSWDFCDRAGCFEPRRPSPRVPSRYCDDTCRDVSRRVRDRERKWKDRKGRKTSTRRRDEHHVPQHERNRLGSQKANSPISRTTDHRKTTVRDYRNARARTLSSRETLQEDPQHDRETSAGRRPRAPPSA
jgi:hypothetical protein